MSREYAVIYSPAAQKYLERLDKISAARIYEKIDLVRTDPWRYTGPLTEMDGLRKLRVGDHRLILRIDENRVIIIVVKVGHRRNIYN